MNAISLAYSKEDIVNTPIATIATSAVLLDLHVSTWTGRKRDKKTTEEVNISKQTTTNKATSVIKNLMSDDKELDAIRAFAQECRLYIVKNTLTWSDGGTRLLPSGMIFEVTGELDARITQYESMVAKFVVNYPVKISAAAFKLGQLFDRNEFPSPDHVAHRFAMRYVVFPVPTSGDFRVDVQNDVGEFLKKQFSKEANARVADMMREPWERAYDALSHIKNRLDTSLGYEANAGEDARSKPKLYQSMFDNAIDLVSILEKLNVTGDPQLADCAARMRRMLTPLDIKSVRESKDIQQSVKKQVEELIGAFDFGTFE